MQVVVKLHNSAGELDRHVVDVTPDEHGSIYASQVFKPGSPDWILSDGDRIVVEFEQPEPQAADVARANQDRLPLSLDNPPKGYVMSVDDLAELTSSSRNNVYAAVAAGVFPSLRQGRKIQVLVVPTLAILRGERPPGALMSTSPRRDAMSPAERRVHDREIGQ